MYRNIMIPFLMIVLALLVNMIQPAALQELSYRMGL